MEERLKVMIKRGEEFVKGEAIILKVIGYMKASMTRSADKL